MLQTTKFQQSNSKSITIKWIALLLLPLLLATNKRTGQTTHTGNYVCRHSYSAFNLHVSEQIFVAFFLRQFCVTKAMTKSVAALRRKRTKHKVKVSGACAEARQSPQLLTTTDTSGAGCFVCATTLHLTVLWLLVTICVVLYSFNFCRHICDDYKTVVRSSCWTENCCSPNLQLPTQLFGNYIDVVVCLRSQWPRYLDVMSLQFYLQVQQRRTKVVGFEFVYVQKYPLDFWLGLNISQRVPVWEHIRFSIEFPL